MTRLLYITNNNHIKYILSSSYNYQLIQKNNKLSSYNYYKIIIYCFFIRYIINNNHVKYILNYLYDYQVI